MTQPIRVLIVDGSERTRDGLRALFETRSDIELVGEASNGQDALDLIADLDPAIVVMDLEMPQSGVETTRRIKAQWPSISVIVVTSSAAKRTAALEAGADDFLVKGDAPGRLLAVLSRVSTT